MSTVDFMMAAWMGLISDGGVVVAEETPDSMVPWVPAVEQYGSGYAYDWHATVEAHDWMVDHGIDLEAMHEPRSDQSSHFTDTYNDPMVVHHLWGDVISGGRTFHWAVETEDAAFGEVVQTLSRLRVLGVNLQAEAPSFTAALEALDERLLALTEHPGWFSRYCRLGSTRWQGLR